MFNQGNIITKARTRRSFHVKTVYRMLYKLIWWTKTFQETEERNCNRTLVHNALDIRDKLSSQQHCHMYIQNTGIGPKITVANPSMYEVL